MPKISNREESILGSISILQKDSLSNSQFYSLGRFWPSAPEKNHIPHSQKAGLATLPRNATRFLVRFKIEMHPYFIALPEQPVRQLNLTREKLTNQCDRSPEIN